MPNNGGWYDFGYFLGIVVFGVGARKTHVVYRDRVVARAPIDALGQATRVVRRRTRR